ncbi:unnamed protein product [Adineta steineri]|uniref:mitogen-activated protein kinase kinase n=1 Tax=Adineta steineri TaxID=433720 RepID=A0A819EB86_9BILA|nr:unnamed protein product [Adineta steineri]
MATNRQSAGRRRRPIPIEFIKCDTDESLSEQASFYTSLEVGEDAKLKYQEQSITINTSMLVEIRRLGFGNFGYVMLTEVQDCPGLQMAVKHLNLYQSTHNPSDFTADTDLRTLRTVGSGENPHVTTFYTALVDKRDNQLLICMEACETSMEKFSTKMHQINEVQHLDLLLKRMINHMVDALSFLKTKNILHRDVKPSNILINQNPVIFKLCDFGICGRLVNSVTATMMKGTGIYLAPERIDKQRSPQGYGIQSDMWALGLSTYEIATNEHPFRGLEAIPILAKAEIWVPQLPSSLSSELQDLVAWLMKVNHTERPQRYQDILESSAMQKLPQEITAEEVEMVKKIIEQIPYVPE